MFFRTRLLQSRVEQGDTDSPEAGVAGVDDAGKVAAVVEVAGIPQVVVLAVGVASMLHVAVVPAVVVAQVPAALPVAPAAGVAVQVPVALPVVAPAAGVAVQVPAALPVVAPAAGVVVPVQGVLHCLRDALRTGYRSLHFLRLYRIVDKTSYNPLPLT